jgi:hypothetical protein
VQTHLLHLRKWRVLGAQQAGFSNQQRAPRYGPDRRVQLSPRTEIGAVPFCVADVDSTGDGEQKRSANSYFIANVLGNGVSEGHFQNFFVVAPPTYL